MPGLPVSVLGKEDQRHRGDAELAGLLGWNYGSSEPHLFLDRPETVLQCHALRVD